MTLGYYNGTACCLSAYISFFRVRRDNYHAPQLVHAEVPYSEGQAN